MRGLDAVANQYSRYKYIPKICYSCGSTKTSKNSRGSNNWFLNLPTELVLCYNCYCRYFKDLTRRKGKFTWGNYGYDLTKQERIISHRKRWNPIYNKLSIMFKGRNIYLGWNPRSGICSKCNKRKQTNMHHLEYYIIFPWFATVELCLTCHGRSHTPWNKNKQMVDMSGRICIICRNSKTALKSNGRPRWVHVNDELVCLSCYNNKRNRR